MGVYFRDLARRRLNWLLPIALVVIVVEHTLPEAHTLIFALSVAAIVPLAGLLSHATEAVAAKTGDAVGGLLGATMGNLTELVIAFAALRAGMPDLVQASIAGTMVTNSLFMLGGSFFLGGLRHKEQRFNKENARMQSVLFLLASVALLIPSALASVDRLEASRFLRPLSVSISLILIATYAAGLLFSLRTHKSWFRSASHGEEHEETMSLRAALATLAVATVLVALVGEAFVGSVQPAARDLGLSPAFVGFVVVSLVSAAAEMATAFVAARKDRLDLSVGVAMGSASQIALFVAPVLVLVSFAVGPAPMDLVFRGGHVLLVLLTALVVPLVVATGRSAWFLGVQLLAVYAVFAAALWWLPA